MSVIDVTQRRVQVDVVPAVTIAGIILVGVAAAMRLFQLDQMAMSWDEARASFESYRFFRGLPIDAGASEERTMPVLHILQSVSYFLFGVTDVTARFPFALAGTLLVCTVFGLRPFLDRYRVFGAAIFVAAAPTLLFASRTVNAEILVALFALLAVVAILRVGLPGQSSAALRGLAIAVGVSLALMFGSSPASLSMMIALMVAFGAGYFGEGEDGAVRRSLTTFRNDRALLPISAIAFVATVITVFSRFFTDAGALAGLGESLADWARLIGGQTSTTPTQFFLLSIILYQLVSLLLAFYEAYAGDETGPGGLHWTFLLGWFIAALLIFSFSSGRSPEQATLVVLPLAIWGGIGAGRLVSKLIERSTDVQGTLLLTAAFSGMLLAAGMFFVVANASDDSDDAGKSVFTVIAVILLAVIPMAVITWVLIKRARDEEEDGSIWPTLVAAIVLVLLFFSWRASVQLSFFRADDGTELLAQRTSTQSVGAFVTRIEKLSRDLTVSDGTAQDPTGGHGLSIAIEEGAQWPLRWYFRDYPNLEVVQDGDSVTSGAELVIAADGTEVESSGYTPRSYPMRNRVPPAYVSPDIGDAILGIINPANWGGSMDYILWRDVEVLPAPVTYSVGYGPTLSQRLYPSSGPYSIFDRPGPGNGRGQFSEPRDLAVTLDTANLFVVDMGNGRVEQFDAGGDYVSTWGDSDDEVQFTVTDTGLGPTGMAVGPDGLVYVADTWNHQIKVFDQTGRLVREFGAFGDNADSPDPTLSPGMMFGPRDIAVVGEEIYIVDTGNERVQVFALDGTFLRAFGGTGGEPGQLVEPVGIAAGPDGNLYVADSGNGRINVYAPDGSPLLEWEVDAWQGQLYFEPYLAFDYSGRLYASSSATGSVEVFNIGGQHLESIRTAGDSALQRPFGLALGADGSILVSDAGVPAVLPLAPTSIEATGDEQVVDELGTPEAIEDVSDSEPTSTPAG